MPPCTALRLASFIADYLLNEVIRHNDLDVKEVDAVRAEVLSRLGKEVGKFTKSAPSPENPNETDALSKSITA